MKTPITVIVAVVLLAAATSLAADAPGGAGTEQRGTVKSSKSNSSERTGAAGMANDRATSVKSGKSNSSDRAKSAQGDNTPKPRSME